MNMNIESFDLIYVLLSFILSVFGSYVALSFAIRIPSSDQKSLPFWLFTSAVALGGGAIWSMHFVGMVALNMPIDVSYNLFLTVSSLLLAIVSCVVGLYVVGRSSGELSRLFIGGSATGLGVAGMHYLGMSAMVMQATVSYNGGIVLLSILIAIIAASVALWLAFNMRGLIQRLGSSVVMGVAVCGMHYTGMFAVNMVPIKGTEVIPASPAGFSADNLGISIFSMSIILMFLLLMINQFKVKSLKLE